MPYIKNENNRRYELQIGCTANNAGELNYQLFYYFKHNEKIDVGYVDLCIRQFLGEKANYQKYNDMAGALVLCYREIKRRLDKNALQLLQILNEYDNVIAEYEDIKIIENGDVE